MSEIYQDRPAFEAVEEVLRGELAKGDVVLATTRPILRHLLANGDQSYFSDEVIAKVRGMLGHAARQLLMAYASAANVDDPEDFIEDRQADLAQYLVEDVAFLSHAHALTMEVQLADQLQRRSGIDCVLSPLLQELAASSDAGMAASAMRVLSSQARFVQQMRRMDLPLGELPGDLFHKALQLLRSTAEDAGILARAEEALRSDYDESESRLGQITQLVMAMGRNAPRALAIDHAGLAIFSTALAMASEQDRNLAILSYGENQLARLALSLRAAGMQQNALEEQFMYLHPEVTLPDGFNQITAERAAAMLGTSQPVKPA